MERLKEIVEVEKSDRELLFQRLAQLEAENEHLTQKVGKLTEEKQRLEAELKKYGRDELTGLMKLKEFSSLLEDRLKNLKVETSADTERKEKFGYTTMAVLFGDLDGFKKMNDTYGHLAGDEILREVGAILQKRLRDTDIVCRYGGDEFVFSTLGTDEGDALWLANNLRDIVRNKIREKFGKIYPEASISLSIGVRTIGRSDVNASSTDLIKEADEAMYKAKITKDAVFSFARLRELSDHTKKRNTA